MAQIHDIDDFLQNVNGGLFKNHFGGAIRFHVILHDQLAKKKYEHLIVECGGRVVQENEINNKTAVLLDGLAKRSMGKVTFNLNYILDCIKKNRFLDITPYRLGYQSTVHHKSYLDVLFWEKEDFDTFEAKIKNVQEEIAESSDESSVITNFVVTKSPALCKNTRAPYTIREKEAILNFIIRSNKFSSLRGDNLWKTMEIRKVCPRRTYQSMKEHFWKTIRMELNRYDFLSEEQKYALKNNVSLPKKIPNK